MKRLLLKSMLLLCALIVGSSNVWADPVTLVSGSGTSNYAVPTGWSTSGTVEGGSYLKFDNGTITSPVFSPHTSLSFTYTVATYSSGTNHPLTIRILNASTDAVIVEKTTATPTSSTYISTDSPLSLGDISVDFKIQLYGPSGKGVRLRNYSISGIPASTDPSSNIAFANENPSLDFKDATSYTQTATTADGYAETVGASVTYSITENSAGATIDENTGEVTPTQTGSVTVMATAAGIAGKFSTSSASYTLTVTDTRTYTVTYHIANTVNNVNRTIGDPLSLDTPTAIAGMSFVGWSSTNNVAAPVWVENTTNVTSDMELYAIYEAVAGEYSYHLVEADQADWCGDYLIAFSSTVFADGRVGGTGENGMGANGVNVNPGTKLIGNTIDAEWGDTYNITIEARNSSDLSEGYLMTTKDGKYNYQTNNSNGLSATETRATAANYPLSISFVSSSNISIANSAGAVFHFNNSGTSAYFRFYKDGGQNNVYLYKKIADVEPVYSLGLTATITLADACTDGAKYYGTYSNNSAFIVPADVTVSAITSADGGKLTTSDYAEGDIVKANTGVLVSSTTAGEKTVVLTAATGTEISGNMLKASGDAGIDAGGMDEANTKFYRLTMHNGTQIGFWWGAENGAAFAVAENKAYLAVPNGSGAREGLWFNDDVTTGINAVENAETVKAVYNLAGQRVAQPTRGLYIVNGKKIVIK